MKYQVLFSRKNNEKIFMNAVCCSRDWCFKSEHTRLKIVFVYSYPLLYMPLPGNVPTEFVTPVKGYRVPPERYTPKHRAFDSTEVPRWV